ncbi:sodium-dependent transporter [Deefgea rivuli]|uniref:sodium-dependent transporter n=1 Tax=Deefgea rivuli TaxID=400948 RepID=UPI0004860D24|nr:sodium-dependent transporter [Deefgea rivuli]
MSTRASWGSKLGFILAASGSAVGLGAIWKFPYVAGKNGGGVFLLVYLACVLTVGIAMVLAEMSIGHAAKKSATTAYRQLKGGLWPWAGRLSVLCIFLILSFYCVVGGWSMAYLWRAITGEILTQDTQALSNMFNGFISDPLQSIAYTTLFLTATALIVMGGVQKGIERSSKILMPALFILMLIIIARVLTLPHAIDGVMYFITPDFSKINGPMLIEATGLAMFSLSIGCGIMIAYGSYVDTETRLPGATLWISLLAVLACILAGLMVLPAVFAFGIDPSAGPGLTFITMPAIFSQMPAGAAFAVAFFLLLIFAALTSSVSLLEPIVAFLMDEFNVARPKATYLIFAAVFLMSIPAALSFGPLADYKLFGKNPFDLMDYVASNIMMPAGGLLAALFVGWSIWPRIHQTLSAQNAAAILPAFRVICAVIAPVVILLVWAHNL